MLQDKIIRLFEIFLSRCAEIVSGMNLKVVLDKIPEGRYGANIKGEALIGYNIIKIEIMKHRNIEDLFRTLVHEIVHFYQAREYGDSYTQTYERYSYVYNPFEEESNIIADDYVDNELQEVIKDTRRDANILINFLNGEMTYSEEYLKEVIKSFRKKITAIMDSCRSGVKPVSYYIEHYVGPGRRRSSRASLLIRLGEYADERDRRSEPGTPSTGQVKVDVDRLADQLGWKLYIKLDGCESNYCITTRIDNIVDKIEDISKSFGVDSSQLLSKVLSTEYVKRFFSSSNNCSIGHIEYLVMNFPQFKRTRHYIGIIRKVLSSYCGSSGGPVHKGYSSIYVYKTSESEDSELEAILNKILNKIVNKLTKRSWRRRRG